MKLSHRWLSRHVDLTGIEPTQILADLTMSTAEIEGLERFGDGLEPLVVGHVRKREKHPDADKLSVCTVDLGAAGGVVQIVCGAPNVDAGQRVVVIQPGDTLPATGGKGALKIKVGKIRGVESHGMICSESELGLSDEADGIFVLPSDAEIGARFVDVCAVQDWVFEIDNKSVNHRPDLWGHYGFARELAAIYGRELRPVGVPQALPEAGDAVDVVIEDRAACPRYCGLRVDGVDSGPSPNELRWMLQAVDQRAINLPVDLTNFVMLDLGQPMHAFDARHVGERPIRVRRAKDGERITTLDGQERALNSADLLICAGDEPEALAGVMGGQGTMVEAGTTSLFLESANFHATTIRRTSMRLGVRTDASTRFEKAQDPANAEVAVHHFLCSSTARAPPRRARWSTRRASPTSPSRCCCVATAWTSSLASRWKTKRSSRSSRPSASTSRRLRMALSAPHRASVRPKTSPSKTTSSKRSDGCSATTTSPSSRWSAPSSRRLTMRSCSWRAG